MSRPGTIRQPAEAVLGESWFKMTADPSTGSTLVEELRARLAAVAALPGDM